MSNHASDTPPTEGGEDGGWVYSALLVLIAFILVVAYFKKEAAQKKERDAAEAVHEEALRRQASVSATMVVVTEKVGPSRTLYTFLSNGCVTTPYLRSDASFYPKGGTVTIRAEPNGQSWDDTPGVPSTNDGKNMPPAQYTICKKDPGAWGVEIWN